MVDHSMPEPAEESFSGRQQALPKQLEIQLKSYKGRIQMARTLGALQTVKRDIEQSNMQQNFGAKEQLRAAANMRARELGHKEGRDWWS